MRSRVRILAALSAVATVASLGAAVIPASAGPTILTGNQNSIGAAGSDTSYWMMEAISPQYNVNTTKNVDKDDVTQIPPLNNAPFPAGTYVPKDDIVAGSFTWTSQSAAGDPARRFVGGYLGAGRRHHRPDRLRPLVARTEHRVRRRRTTSGRTRSARSTT